MDSKKELSFGEDLVGIDFNHAKGGTGDKVALLKELFAQVANIVEEDYKERRGDTFGSYMPIVPFHEHAILNTLDAQMACVKAITRKPNENPTSPSTTHQDK